LEFGGVPITASPPLRLATDSDLSGRVIGCYFRVYNDLGPGFVEPVYARALALEFAAAGLKADAEVSIEVYYRDGLVGSFRADFVVEDQLLLELKAVPSLVEAHSAQVLNYLSASSIELALLVNFGGRRPQIRRLAIANSGKRRQRRGGGR
jgi:GxxExxY protein